MGKSSNGKIIYANDSVFELQDILKLKRRSTSTEKKAKEQQRQQQKPTHYYQHHVNAQKKNHLLTASSVKDVVSAVQSGMLHARKANDKLDSMKTCPAALTSSYCRTTNSSLSQSASTDNAAKKKPHKKKSSPSLQKYKLGKKDRARLKKMLHYNRIVPFIHVTVLPMMVEVDSNDCTTKRNSSESDLAADSDEKRNSKKNKSNANETAANALLSLSSPCHENAS